jgi:hypothetical protein
MWVFVGWWACARVRTGGGTHAVVDTVPEVEVLSRAVRADFITRLGVGVLGLHPGGACLELLHGLGTMALARIVNCLPVWHSSADRQRGPATPKLKLPTDTQHTCRPMDTTAHARGTQALRLIFFAG